MALLLETVLGDIVIDLDLKGSPDLCKNVLKLAKARYYTQSLIYQIQASYAAWGCPRGNGQGGASIFGYLNSASDEAAEQSAKRFLQSRGRVIQQPMTKGTVVALEIGGVEHTIGSQLAIILRDGNDLKLPPGRLISVGTVVEDQDGVLDKLAAAYCDGDGRPVADIRIHRALVVEDPFEDPPGLSVLMKRRGVVVEGDKVIDSPSPERPPLETVEKRIALDQVDEEEDEAKLKERETEAQRKEDHGRAVVLEMLGDLPDADIKTPENVLFICKLNPATVDEDLELIFSRFDPSVKVEIIRDHDTGRSLQYAFAEFSQKQQAVEAYFKMNNALIDDRRIKVDFSQSVAKIWDKYNQRMKMPTAGPGGDFGGRGRGPPNRGQGHGRDQPQRRLANSPDRAGGGSWRHENDEFGRRRDDGDHGQEHRVDHRQRDDRHDHRQRGSRSREREERRRSRDRYGDDHERRYRRYSDDEDSRQERRRRKHKQSRHGDDERGRRHRDQSGRSRDRDISDEKRHERQPSKKEKRHRREHDGDRSHHERKHRHRHDEDRHRKRHKRSRSR